MKKFTSLLIGCSLALAGAAMAQAPEQSPTEQQAPKKGGHGRGHAAEGQPGANQANPEAGAGKQRGGKGQRGASTEQNPQQTAAPQQGARHQRGGAKGQKGEMTPKPQNPTGTETGTNASGQPSVSATPNAKEQTRQGRQGRKGMKGAGANANTAPTATPATGASASASPVTAAAPSATPATGAASNTAPSVAPNNQQTGQANAQRGAKRKPDPQQVQQIKQQHTNFRAQPRPDRVPAVTFNQSYRIEGSDRWQGPQYEVFRSYHPERHDQGWYRSRYNRVELIGGGYYYWNNGYWYPAWGYNPSNEYYAYDGPIYVGHRAEPPDRVIADVQAELQQMGYYTGEVDGLLGPLTRQALTAYQADQGLTATAVIDEPTLESLGMG
jgi:hypothetical protein